MFNKAIPESPLCFYFINISHLCVILVIKSQQVVIQVKHWHCRQLMWVLVTRQKLRICYQDKVAIIPVLLQICIRGHGIGNDLWPRQDKWLNIALSRICFWITLDLEVEVKFGLPLIEAMNRDRPGLAMTTLFIFSPWKYIKNNQEACWLSHSRCCIIQFWTSC